MPIIRGAKKAHRASLQKRVYNTRRKSVMQGVIKQVRKLAASGDMGKAAELLPSAYKAIDKAAKRGVIKDNTASRKKARLAKAIKGTK